MNKIKHQIDIVRETSNKIADLPSDADITHWVNQTLYFEPQFVDAATESHAPLEIAIKIVTDEEMRVLNNTYRQIDKTTNVLSFPMDEMPLPQFEGMASGELCRFLGDIAICADVLKSEAQAQDKSLEAHFAHMIVHGVLHLMGYDHVDEQEASEMERLEVQLLDKMGFDDPYLDGARRTHPDGAHPSHKRTSD